MPKNDNSDVTRDLTDLGLSANEAKVYLATLYLTEASAGAILERVRLHREQVYRALKQLVGMGLIAQTIKRKRAVFTAIDPKMLVSHAKAKLETAEAIQPFLKKLYTENSQIIRVSEGTDAIPWLLDDLLASLPNNTEYQVLGGAGHRFYGLVKDYWPKFQRICERRGISYRTLTYQGQDYRHADLHAKKKNYEIRALPSYFISPTATIIYGDRVGLEIFDTDNPENTAAIIIENAKVAESYRYTFERFWEQAGSLEPLR